MEYYFVIVPTIQYFGCEWLPVNS